MKFQKKIEIVEAVQFDPATAAPDKLKVIDVSQRSVATKVMIYHYDGLTVNPGDWIVTDVQGQTFIMSDELFKLYYEKMI